MRSYGLISLLLLVVFSAFPAGAQLVANPNDLDILVVSPGGVAHEDGDRVAGPATIMIGYEAPKGPNISTVTARLVLFTLNEKFPASPEYVEPQEISLSLGDDNNPVLLQPILDENGQPTSVFSIEIPWATRTYHNGPHIISAGLLVTLTFKDGGGQTLNYYGQLQPIVRNLTVDDLTGVAPMPPNSTLAMLGEPTDNQPVAPLAEPAFLLEELEEDETITFKCVANSAQGGAVRMRYEIFSCDNPDAVLVTHEEDGTLMGLGGGNSTPAICTWEWDGTKTVGVGRI